MSQSHPRTIGITANLTTYQKYVLIPATTTLRDVRERLLSMLAIHVQITQGLQAAIPLHPENYSSVLISSSSKGFKLYKEDNILLGDIVQEDEQDVNAIVFLTNQEANAPSDILVELMAGHWDRAVDITRGGIRVEVQQKDETAAQYRELEAEWENMQNDVEDIKRSYGLSLENIKEGFRQQIEGLGKELEEMKKSKDEEIGKLREELRLERKERKQADVLYSIAIEKALEQKDTTSLNQIRFREVLNLAQEEFATLIGLTGKNLSLKWRQSMDRYGADTVVRRNHARRMLLEVDKDPSPSHQALIKSDQAMDLICEESSTIRIEGDEAAHPTHGIPAHNLSMMRVLAAQIPDPERQSGLLAIIDFLLAQPQRVAATGQMKRIGLGDGN